jgi:pSer/pThr/pTyr-binding forkhead associated (FHA) protein
MGELEVQADCIDVYDGRRLETSIELTRSQYSVGRSPDNDVVLGDDMKVSRAHALLERIGPSWFVRDLSSTDGTHVNGDRISYQKLQDNDVIHIGSKRIVYRTGHPDALERTEVPKPCPELTRGEKRVLVELCRPRDATDHFLEPAEVNEIADKLVVGRAAVEQHLLNMYRKFGIKEGNKRVRLANEALRRRCIGERDFRANADP